MAIEELPKLDYCIELKEMWEQHNDIIKWTSPAYAVGFVRLGDTNLARISFWEESHFDLTKESTRYVGRNRGVDKDGYIHYTTKEIADDLLMKTYYYGVYINIHSIATGKVIWKRYKIDFGDDAYLHKEDWTWRDDYKVDVTELIKKAGRAMMWIEAWCK